MGMLTYPAYDIAGLAVFGEKYIGEKHTKNSNFLEIGIENSDLRGGWGTKAENLSECIV